jgi:hypothetical protein
VIAVGWGVAINVVAVGAMSPVEVRFLGAIHRGQAVPPSDGQAPGYIGAVRRLLVVRVRISGVEYNGNLGQTIPVEPTDPAPAA